MKILIHTSKTMKQKSVGLPENSTPQFLAQAKELMLATNQLSPQQLTKLMHISPKLAETVAGVHSRWSDSLGLQSRAVDTFVGDIYSGLQSADWSLDERNYAQEHLYILSGLYGILRPNDGVMPYRLEMGYSLPGPTWKNLYDYWKPYLMQQFNDQELIVNLSAVEYTKALLPELPGCRVVQPYFMSMSPKTNQPTFVVVHAKIARGAFASWLIRAKIQDPARFSEFNDLGYAYSAKLSTEDRPVFVCREFRGLGLSVRLS